MTGEALSSLWWVIGPLNHPKSHTRRKHSRLKGSQLVLITWCFQDVGLSPPLFLRVSYSISCPLQEFWQEPDICERWPSAPTDHRCQNCQLVVLARGGGGIGGECETEESLCLVFFYSKQPPETLREEEGDSLVEEKEAAMKCWQLSCLAVKEGNFFRSLWMRIVFFFLIYFPLLCIFIRGVFPFFETISLSQLC